jgi:hypothetical protein
MAFRAGRPMATLGDERVGTRQWRFSDYGARGG